MLIIRKILFVFLSVALKTNLNLMFLILLLIMSFSINLQYKYQPLYNKLFNNLENISNLFLNLLIYNNLILINNEYWINDIIFFILNLIFIINWSLLFINYFIQKNFKKFKNIFNKLSSNISIMFLSKRNTWKNQHHKPKKNELTNKSANFPIYKANEKMLII